MLLIDSTPTSIFFYVLCAILAIMVIVGWILYISVSIYQSRTKHMKVDLPITASELARANLDKAGLTDVKVVVASRSGFNRKKNTIYLTRKMERKLTAFSVARVMQSVSLAINANLGVNKGKKSGGLFHGFSTAFLLGITVFSIVMQCVAHSNGIKWFTYSMFAIAIILYIIAIFNSKKNKSTLAKANETALVFIEKLDVFTEKDIVRIKKFYKKDEDKIMIERTISVMFVFYFIIQIIATIFKRKK